MIKTLKSMIRKRFDTKYGALARENQKLIFERDELLKMCGIVPPGHFYSVLPSLEEVRKDEAKIWKEFPRSIPGINLHEAEQFDLLKEFLEYYQDVPFSTYKTEGMRYYFENPMYAYSDAIFLHCIIRYLKPRRIIEIGSGFSSCAILDTNELFFDNSISTTFIEPYPDKLMSLIKIIDKSRIKVIPKRLQDVDLEVFKALNANDILFIDSTHVSKINSDVNCIFFEILPSLLSGVHIHFHDIFYPFEYPRLWTYQGYWWNEIYILRAFLEYNTDFEIVFMNTFMEHFYEQFFEEKMPLCMKNKGGSIWLRKL